MKHSTLKFEIKFEKLKRFKTKNVSTSELLIFLLNRSFMFSMKWFLEIDSKIGPVLEMLSGT
jgi:hypothetical protein